MDENRLLEEAHLQEVLDVIDRKTEHLLQSERSLHQDVVELKRTFSDEVRVNVDSFAEAFESGLTMKQQMEFLSERERTHAIREKQLKTLTKLRQSPYFARVDFLEDGADKPIPLYIGVASLLDENEEEALLFDWRAPISSIYYDYVLGPAQYETEDDVVQGDIKLKRQFIIRNSELKAMFDSGLAIGDELLQEMLGSNASDRMKSIVATIQREQNQIIRNQTSRYLIVQGAAGSGKTSVALQRVAFLLYQYMNELTAENMLLFSPNPLFSSYVSSVLPELGEENVQQMTFQEYTASRLGKRFELESPFSQMEFMLATQNEAILDAKKAGIHFKAGLEFKHFIDNYVEQLSKEGMIFKNISFRGRVLVSAEQIRKNFYAQQVSSIPNRLQLTMNWILEELSKHQKLERRKDWAVEESELLDLEEYTDVYTELRNEGRYTDESFDDFKREQRRLAARVVQRAFKPLRIAVKKYLFVNTAALYRQLFKPDNPIHQGRNEILPSEWTQICNYTLESLRNRVLLYEDAAPFLYLEDQLFGKKVNPKIRHLFIDEAQDYSPFQFFVLKQLFPAARMTILGDLHQAIYAQAENGPTLLSTDQFLNEPVERVTLMKSYRSTQEIVAFTKQLIANGDKIEAFTRGGEKPVLHQLSSVATHHEKIAALVQELLTKKYGTIAVICKTAQESKAAYEKLCDQMDIQLLEQGAHTFRKGVVILPAYLAKGIEFDAVIIYDASAQKYAASIERNLFYTACTRAMHELHLFSVGDPTPFMNNVPPSFYTKINE